MSALLALLLAAQAPAQAVPPAPVSAETIDPARLKAAEAVIDLTMPPDRREAMLDAMLRPMMTNMQQGMLSSPSFKALVAKDPKVMPVFERFLADSTERSLTRLRAGLPTMVDAMRRAYARRFTVEQLREIGAFLATPTGRVYIDQGATIMADPDIQAWQRGLMASAMEDMQQNSVKFVEELKAMEK